MGKQLLHLDVNGRTHEVAAPGSALLLEVLRDQLALTGTKQGCDGGECGACTVLVDGQPRLSCITLAASVQGKRIETIEALAQAGRMSRLQQAFHEKLGTQCGFCTPGMVMAAEALLRREPQPTEEQIREALAGNLCRCTGYVKIVESVQAAAHAMKREPHALDRAPAPPTHSIGERTPLVDGIEKVTGRARYTADLPLGHALVGLIGRSRVAHATIRSIDTRKALALPGVRAVITGDDFSAPYGVIPIAQNEWPLARGKVRYRGEPLFAVAAETEEAARAALAAVEVEFDELPAFFSADGRARRRRRAAARRQAGQPGAEGRAGLRRRRRGLRRRGPRARAPVRMRRGGARPDRAELHRRPMGARARAAHRALGDAGALLPAPDAGADAGHRRIAGACRQALRRGRLRAPRRAAQLRDDHRGAGPRGGRHGEAGADARGGVPHAPRPSAQRDPPEDRREAQRRDHRAGGRGGPARRRLRRLRPGHDPLRRRAAACAVQGRRGALPRLSRVHQPAALRRDARPRRRERAFRGRVAARRDGAAARAGPLRAAPGQPDSGALPHAQRPAGQFVRPAASASTPSSASRAGTSGAASCRRGAGWAWPARTTSAVRPSRCTGAASRMRW